MYSSEDQRAVSRYDAALQIRNSHYKDKTVILWKPLCFNKVPVVSICLIIYFMISLIFHDAYDRGITNARDAYRLLRGFKVVGKTDRHRPWLLYTGRVWYARQIVFYPRLCQSIGRYWRHTSTIGYLARSNVISSQIYKVCIAEYYTCCGL